MVVYIWAPDAEDPALVAEDPALVVKDPALDWRFEDGWSSAGTLSPLRFVITAAGEHMCQETLVATLVFMHWC